MNDRYEYIRNLEEAIVEKYGENTTKSFMEDWTIEKEKDLYEKELPKFFDKQKEKEVIFLDENTRITKTKRDCGLKSKKCSKCNLVSFSELDDIYLVKHKLCLKCFYQGEKING